MPIFKKKFDSPKMAAILNFEFYAKIAKHKNANISKTVLDGELSLKSMQIANFSQIIHSPTFGRAFTW